MRHAMIMAGGSGTRLWPMSRKSLPKQLVPFIERQGGAKGRPKASLLEISAERLRDVVPQNRRLICTSESYRGLIRAAMPQFTDEQIIGEPVGRDTVNAVGLTAAVLAKHDKDAVFCVLTADHLIEPVEKFAELMHLGFQLVESDPLRLVTFSIKPTYPATGFGYVERGRGLPGTQNLAYRVERFVEKPDAQRAQAYLESGVFGWNSGMFVWKASTILDCLRRYKPESFEGLMKIQSAWGTPSHKQVLEQVYPTLPKISVDYAIMEPATREQARASGTPNEASSVKVCTVLMDLTWLDVGSWPSYGETLQADEQGNRVSVPAAAPGGGGAAGRVLKCSNTLVVSDDPAHYVAVLGCENLIVVHTRDATLVMPRERAEELKLIHAELPEALK